MNQKHVPGTIVGLVLLAVLFFSAQAQEDSTVYIPFIAGPPAASPTVLPTATPRPTPAFPAIYGYVQKGPFIQGTEIMVRELDDTLNPTGRSFSGVIDDNTGSFVVRGELAYPYAELSATGYYFNEVAGVLSVAPINLQALVDTREVTSIFVNVLTHLERRRVFYLFDENMPFRDAKAQAQQEILNVFAISAMDIQTSEMLDISSAGNGNAVLLAISAILQSNKSEAQLTELLSTISNDLRTDGTLENTSIQQTLTGAMEYLKSRHTTIRSNIVERYASQGMTIHVPAFEDFAFELDNIPPTVISTVPIDNANYSVTSVSVTFSDIMDHATLNSGSVILSDVQNKPILGLLTATDTETTTTAVFTPTAPLTSGDYQIRVDTQVKDLGGNNLASSVNVSFTHTPIEDMPEILIPEGSFQMGCSPTDGCYSHEYPLHTVYLDAYYIDKYEVTNGHYKACVDAGSCTAPDQITSNTRPSYYGDPNFDHYPVINVTWNQASMYCTWANKRLPTEAEWEKAARGSSDVRRYAWGDSEPNSTLLNYNGEIGDTTPVGTYPAGASPYEVMDMAGNVWEWVNDWWQVDYYSVSPDRNPQGPATGDIRMIRGGAWHNDVSYVRLSYRASNFPGYRANNLGFRCVHSP